MRGLTQRGHDVTLWLEDCERRHDHESEALTKRSFAEFFGGRELELHVTLDNWTGADLVLATGWETVPRVLLLPGAGGRAYLVQDHEPDFYPASAERLLAAGTYRHGLHCIAASPWLAETLRGRYGASASHFDLAVDHASYRASADARRGDLVVFYARAVTPRRAVPLGLLALEELSRRRPDVEIALFGEALPLAAAFRHTHLGVLDQEGLAKLYSQATVGMVFSLTNPSLIGLEMMACGLPGVELSTDANRATFGSDGPLVLAPPDLIEICSAIERLLDDPLTRGTMAERGTAYVRERTWPRAAEQVELGLRSAIENAQRMRT
jgi:glycosyltransferase involved in cell wall biosynthesis